MFENFEPAKSAAAVPTDWLTYLGVIAISFFGGLVSFFEKKEEKFSWISLFAHSLSAVFAGFLTYLGCQYMHITGPLVGIVCALAGHFGTPALLAFAAKLKIVQNVLEKEGLEKNGDKKQ